MRYDWKIWKPFLEGVSKHGNSFDIDMSSDKSDDIIEVVSPTNYQSEILGNVYWFGYGFTDNASSMIRTQFTRWIKGLDNIKPTEGELRRFIEKPLAILNREVPLSTFSGFIFPKSGRSELVQKIIKVVGNYLPSEISRKSFELIKSIPNKIKFDWEKFNSDISDTATLRNSSKYISDVLLPKIHNRNYFSIGEVKPKYRSYIYDYLQFESDDIKKAFMSIEKGRILIIDDIDTTKSTLSEILRIVNQLNPQCEVFIFTLIGKD